MACDDCQSTKRLELELEDELEDEEEVEEQSTIKSIDVALTTVNDLFQFATQHQLENISEYIFKAITELQSEKLKKRKKQSTVPATGNVKMKRVRTRLVAKFERVCVHHAQVMLGAQSMISTRSKTAANQLTSLP